MKINGAGAVGAIANRSERQLQPDAVALKTGFPQRVSRCVMAPAPHCVQDPSSDDDPAGKDARASMHTDRSLVEEPCWGGLEPANDECPVRHS